MGSSVDPGLRRLTFFVGTRPEAIKLLPVIRALRQQRWAAVRVVSTGQHSGLLHRVMHDLGLECQAQLRIDRRSGSLNEVSAWLVAAVSEELVRHPPSLAVVQGDTTSALAAALAAFHARVPVAHVEAGLRTYRDTPFPEEANRQLIARLASLHFAPTPGNKVNLVREQVPAEAVYVTGNTSIDEVHRRLGHHARPARRTGRPRMLLVTAHRRESWGAPMSDIRAALHLIAVRHPDLSVVFPVHLNPRLRATLGFGRSVRPPNLRFIEPPPPNEFFRLLVEADVVLTDSGSIQEEAPALGKPTLILREATERPEVIAAGTARLVGTTQQSIVEGVERVLGDPMVYRSMARPVSPFGDGRAGERIADILHGYWHAGPRATEDFVGGDGGGEAAAYLEALP
jgi:UDP-N-acetylglucosamine 2-epimerase (non-hydrolysing)